jgi:hypothetical protein
MSLLRILLCDNFDQQSGFHFSQRDSLHCQGQFLNWQLLLLLSHFCAVYNNCEVDHSPPPSAEVKNAWRCTSTLNMSIWRGAWLIKEITLSFNGTREFRIT